MFVNISSDRIYFMYQGKREVLPFSDLEKTVPWFLYTKFSETLGIDPHSLSKNQLPIEVFVLNWPWSFTDIRIGTLALNAYNMLLGFPLEFFSVNKLQRYKILYIQKKVSQYCLMYIWQKKNYWLVDLEKLPEDIVFSSDKNDFALPKNQTYIQKISLVNLWSVLQELPKWTWFIDELIEDAKERVESICEENNLPYTQYMFSEEDISLVKEYLIEKKIPIKEKLLPANYMIEANIS